jgi:hypothetical protein
MALAERKANVVWNGTLTDGSGTLTLNSGAATLPDHGVRYRSARLPVERLSQALLLRAKSRGHIGDALDRGEMRIDVSEYRSESECQWVSCCRSVPSRLIVQSTTLSPVGDGQLKTSRWLSGDHEGAT